MRVSQSSSKLTLLKRAASAGSTPWTLKQSAGGHLVTLPGIQCVVRLPGQSGTAFVSMRLPGAPLNSQTFKPGVLSMASALTTNISMLADATEIMLDRLIT